MTKSSQRVLQVLELFRQEQARRGMKQERFGYNALEVYFLVSTKKSGGISITEISNRLGLAQSVVSKNVMMLADKDVRGNGGLGFLTTERDSLDARRTVVRMSKAGERFQQRIEDIMG